MEVFLYSALFTMMFIFVVSTLLLVFAGKSFLEKAISPLRLLQIELILLCILAIIVLVLSGNLLIAGGISMGAILGYNLTYFAFEAILRYNGCPGLGEEDISASSEADNSRSSHSFNKLMNGLLPDPNMHVKKDAPKTADDARLHHHTDQ